MKPKQIQVHLYWKGVYGRDQEIFAIASSMSLLDQGAIKTISVSFEGLPSTIKGAFEAAKRVVNDSMVFEISVQDEHTRLTFHGSLSSIQNCSLVKELDRFIVEFAFEELRKNESYSLTELAIPEVAIGAYGSDIEDMTDSQS